MLKLSSILVSNSKTDDLDYFLNNVNSFSHRCENSHEDIHKLFHPQSVLPANGHPHSWERAECLWNFNCLRTVQKVQKWSRWKNFTNAKYLHYKSLLIHSANKNDSIWFRPVQHINHLKFDFFVSKSSVADSTCLWVCVSDIVR